MSDVKKGAVSQEVLDIILGVQPMKSDELSESFIVVIEEKRVFSPEEHGVLDYSTLPKAEVPDVVVEQGPNTNGDIFTDRAQRMRDLMDLSFRPAYVTSKPDPKSIMAGVMSFMTEPEFFGALTPEKLAASAEHTRKVLAAWWMPGAVMATIGFGRWTGWDANGAPTEEWP